MKVFIAVTILGFPIALVFSWAFEITPEGIKRTTDTSPDEAPDIVRQRETRDRQQFVHGYLCALIYAGLGDKTRAIDYLKREYLGDDKIEIPGIRVDPLLDVPRNDPRSKTVAAETPGIHDQVGLS